MGRLSNYTLAGIESQLYPGRAEFRRGKDKKKRKKRSMTDNILGTTTSGRIARGVGAAGAVGTGLLALRAAKILRPGYMASKAGYTDTTKYLQPKGGYYLPGKGGSSAGRGSAMANVPLVGQRPGIREEIGKVGNARPRMRKDRTVTPLNPTPTKRREK